jgi:hypothetical protein
MSPKHSFESSQPFEQERSTDQVVDDLALVLAQLAREIHGQENSLRGKEFESK